MRGIGRIQRFMAGIDDAPKTQQFIARARTGRRVVRPVRSGIGSANCGAESGGAAIEVVFRSSVGPFANQLTVSIQAFKNCVSGLVGEAHVLVSGTGVHRCCRRLCDMQRGALRVKAGLRRKTEMHTSVDRICAAIGGKWQIAVSTANQFWEIVLIAQNLQVNMVRHAIDLSRCPNRVFPVHTGIYSPYRFRNRS